MSEIDSDLKSKTFVELGELEKMIKSNIENGEVVDEEYWQSLLRRIHIKKNEAKYSLPLLIE